MKVTLTATLEGKVALDVSAQVDTFGDLARLARCLDAKVKGVKKALPDMMEKPVIKVSIATE